jgi:hypothetical protein
MEQRVPKELKRVEATATLRFKQKRRRDEGNHRALLEKALGDVLQAGGWLKDDTPDLYRFGRLNMLAPVPQAETIVLLDYER